MISTDKRDGKGGDRSIEAKKYTPNTSFAEWSRAYDDLLAKQRDHRAALLRVQNGSSTSEQDRAVAQQYLDANYTMIERLGAAFGATVERLGTYPADLVVPEDKTPFIDPHRESAAFPEASQPFAQLTIGDRRYVFSLVNDGFVNVHLNGKYIGGNHDLSLREIFRHLEEGNMFGVVTV